MKVDQNEKRIMTYLQCKNFWTRNFANYLVRVLSNTFVTEYEKSGLEPLTWPLQRFVANDIYENAQTKDNTNYYPLYSGQALRMLKRNQSAEEVIANLLTNAVKFTQEGTITISVDKTSKDDNKNWVIVSVKDTGKGIDINILPRLFTKFASSHGTGLAYLYRKALWTHSVCQYSDGVNNQI